MSFFDITPVNVLLFISFIVFVFYKYITANNKRWKDAGISYKEPVLIFGNIKDFVFARATFGEIYQKIYNEFPNEKYVGCYKSRQPDLMIKDPELIKCVLVKDFTSFHDRNKEVTDKVEKINGNLFSVQGTKWKTMRQKMTPVFTSGKLRYMFHLVVEKAEEFQSYLVSECMKNDEQEVRELMARFTTEVIGSCGFGVNMNSIHDSNAPFRKMGRQIFAANRLKAAKVLLRIFAPGFFEFFRMRILEKEAEDFFVSTVKNIIRDRITNNVKRQDFIDLMLELKSKGVLNETGLSEKEMEEYSDIFITAQAFIFFAAGFETSSGVMTFTLYELAKNPDIQKKVIEEINVVLQKHEGKFSYDCIAEMHYLECVVSETMRKYPALGVLQRVCNTQYTFPGTKLTLNKGESISIPVYALHYDPQYFPEPDKFIPERFTAEAKQDRHPMVYLPFGEGPRNCIGLRFGKMQSMIGLVAVLSKFTVLECPRTEKKVSLNPLSFVVAPKNGVWLKLKARNNA